MSARRKIDLYALTWRLPIIIWQAIFFVGPVLFMIAISFYVVKNYRMTEAFEFVNWQRMLTRGFFWDSYWYTLFIASLSASIAMLLAFPAAWALAFRASENVRRWAVFLLIIPFFTSYLVRTFSWYVILAESGVLNAMLEYIGLGPYRMLNTHFGTIVGYLTLTLPLAVILQTVTMANIDRTLVEAARNLGCKPLATIWRVVLPLSKTGFIVAALFCFILAFGDFVAPFYLGGSQEPTLPILILDTTKSGQQWPRAAVVAIMMMLTLFTVAFTAIALAYRKPKGTLMQGRGLNILLALYVALIFVFIFSPIFFSLVFSFNSQRFPTIPLGEFSTEWYARIFSDEDVWQAVRNSVVVSTSTAVLATFLGFCTAYSDFRYNFRFKGPYLALILLPPTILLIIMALAMLAWLSRLGLSGQLWSIVMAHSVLTAPFAMAIIRLRLHQMDPDLEAAAWNLGGSEWQAMRHVILPFCAPAIVSSLCLTAAVSFDEFAISWFVSGLNKTVPVLILEIVQGNIDPTVNAIGTFVFLTSMTLVILAQLIFITRQIKSHS